MADLVLAIDQGTTGTTALVVDGGGKILGWAYEEIRQYFPHSGWVEHNPEEIYESVVATARRALRAARAGIRDLSVVGITNQRETFVVWERQSGRPLGRAIVWQCRRSAEICLNLRPYEEEITAITGLVLDPYFSGTKLKWFFDQNPKLRVWAARGKLCFGTVDSWLIFKLSGGANHLTDLTNASRTLMLDLSTLRWSEPMLRLFGVPSEVLPCIVKSCGPIAEAKAGTIGSRAVLIGACVGDQQSALYGHGAVRQGQAMTTYGTGAFVLVHTGAARIHSKNRLLSTIALGPKGEPLYAVEGSVFIAGAVIQWMRDNLGLIKKSSETSSLARSANNTGELYVVPAFTGMGAPYWDSEARGAILGITRATTRADLVRAALDSIAFQIYDVLEEIENAVGVRLTDLHAGGGAAANDYLMQVQADLFGRPVRRLAMLETTALGAAMLAGLAAGLWRSTKEVLNAHKKQTVFKPKLDEQRRAKLIQGWHEAVKRVLSQRI